MHNHLMKGLAVALCVSLSFSMLTGCSGKKEAKADLSAPAITLNEDTMSEGCANFILRYEQAQFENGIGMLYRMYAGYTDLWNQDLTGQGVPYGYVFRSEQQENMKRMVLAKANMDKYSVELTEEDQKAITDAATAFLSENSEETLEKMSATQETVEEALTYYTILSKVEEAMGEEVDKEVSDEEAAQRTVQYLSFDAVTEEEEEEITEAEEEITEAAEALTEGEAAPEEESDANTGAGDTEELTEAAEEVTEAAEEVTEAQTEEIDPEMEAARAKARSQAESFLIQVAGCKSAEEFTEAAGAAAEGSSSIYSSSFTFGADSTYPDAAIIQATEGLEDNTLVNQVIQAGDTFYVLFVSDAFDEEATERQKETIVNQRITDHQDEVFNGWAEEQEVTVEDTFFAGLVFDFALAQETEAETEGISEAFEYESETGEDVAE